MKILLIKPKWHFWGGAYKNIEENRLPPLSLGIIAALSEGHEIEIIDLDEQKLNYDTLVDVVAITVPTMTVPQVSKISKEFQKRGKKVIVGGVHPTLVPESCLQFADAVVVGESEYTWPKVLKDLETGDLKKIYKAERLVNMDDVPFPRRDLYYTDYKFDTIQATRGCVNSCKFCYLCDTGWRRHRVRDVKLVYEELKQAKSNYFHFVDDNLFANPEYAAELFDKIKDLRKKWFTQAPLTIAENGNTLRKAAKSGCFQMSLGFQSIYPESLRNGSVLQNNVSIYKDVVKRLHRHGIFAEGFFMFGFDHDDPDVFDRTVAAIEEIGLDDVFLYIQTPPPGTRLYEDLEKERRIVCRDLGMYTWNHCIYEPRLMSCSQVEEGIKDMYKKLNVWFRKMTIKRAFRHWRLAVRSPWLAGILFRAGLRKVDVGQLK